MSENAVPGVIRIGCAGWNVPRDSGDSFPEEGSHLERYAQRFFAVEINSSFYRPHRPATYARWAQSVPADFKFSVKAPKKITHELRLSGASAALDQFLYEVITLGDKLGCLLVQLPPSLQFDAAIAAAFFSELRAKYAEKIACEPRHATWFSVESADLLGRYKVARVAADPALHPGASEPAGDPSMQYFRLHGSPRTYFSRYTDEYLALLAKRLIAGSGKGLEVWCIFDNTAAGHAIENALQLRRLVA